MRTGWILPLCTLALASGCTDIPLGGEPRIAVHEQGLRKLGRLSVAPVTTVSLAKSELVNGWKADEVFVHGGDLDLRAGVVHGLDLTSSYEGSVRLAASADLGDAWEKGDDLLLTMSIQNVRIGFERNGWYVPNVVNFVFWIFPAWVVAKEDYTLAFDAHAEVTSCDSGQPVVHDLIIPVSATGSFDEFDRGLQLFGPISPSNEPENWRLIATKLYPAVRRELAQNVVAALEKSLRAAADNAQHKTLVLAVGITRYADADRLPRLAYAAEDAQALGATLSLSGLSLPHHAVVLTDDRASAAAVTSAVHEHLGRAHEGDDIIVYFSGYGTRSAAGVPVLLFNDSDGTKGSLSLPDLAAVLSKLPGRVLLILDTSFDGGARSVRGGACPAGDVDLSAALLYPNLRIMAAAEPKQSAFASEHRGHGVFTYFVLGGLAGNADENHDGRVTTDELFDYVHDRVIAETGYTGESQAPHEAGTCQLSFGPRQKN